MEEEQLSHHKKQDYCTTRPVYREGRRLKAVKVYTINDESRYLIVQGVPAVGGAIQELLQRFALYGRIAEYRILDEYPTADQFTDVFWIKYENIQSARIAKRKLDDISFFGGVLHVCYAPECESVGETREKLVERRKVIAAKCREFGYEMVTAARSSEKFASSTASATEETDEHERPSGSIDHPSLYVEASLASEGEQRLAPKAGHSEPRQMEPRCGAADSLAKVPNTGRVLTGRPYMNVERHPHLWPPQSAHHTMSTAFPEPQAIPVPRVTVAKAAGKVHAATEAGVWQRTTFTDLPPDGSTSERHDLRTDLVARKGDSSRANNASALRTHMIRAVSGHTAASVSLDSTSIIIRQYSPATGTAQPPRFVPRQAAAVGKTCRAPAGATLAAANSSGRSSIGAPLPDNELKRNATILGKMQGPAVTPEQAATLKATITGSEVLDQTVYEIRGRIRKALSAVTDEHATKKKLQQPSTKIKDRHA